MDTTQQQHTFQFTGTTSEYFKIWIVNSLLTLITLGIYYSWAKVKTNHYFYSNTLLNDAPFQYHAKPKQLLMGSILLLIFFAIILGLTRVLSIATTVLLPLLLLAIPFIVYKSILFNAKMTSYQQVRFRLKGGLFPFYKILFLYPLIPFSIIIGIATSTQFFEGSANSSLELNIFAVISLFLSFPWIQRTITQHIVNHCTYGKEGFLTTPALENVKYYGRYIFAIVLPLSMLILFPIMLSYLLKGNEEEVNSINESGIKDSIMIIVYGVSFFMMIVSKAYLQSGLRGHVLAHTKLVDKLSFQSTSTTNTLFILLLTNLLLLLVTLGLAYPLIKIRSARYFAQHTHVYTQNDFSLNEYATKINEKSIREAENRENNDILNIDLGLKI